MPSRGATQDNFTFECRTGRLIEGRVFSLRTPEDADGCANAIAAIIARLPVGVRPVLCSDHRPVAIYAQPVATRLGEAFLGMNARLDRIAILVMPSNATLLLQLDRLVREASFANRKVVHAPEAAIEHLGPSLDAHEAARARAFLAEWPPA